MLIGGIEVRKSAVEIEVRNCGDDYEKKGRQVCRVMRIEDLVK